MKTTRLLVVAALSAVAALSTGCPSRIIASASTRLEISTETGKRIVFVMPKEVDTSDFEVSYNLTTGEAKLKADKFNTKSAAVIDSAGTANAAAITALAAAVQTLTATAAKAAAQAALAP